MPGQPTFSVAGSYSSTDVPGVSTTAGQPSHMAFIVWVVVLGVLLPAFILGGLNLGGWKFAFKGR